MTDVNGIPEKHIEVALRYLKYHDPENATREKAIAMLQDIKSGLRSVGQNDPDRLFDLQKEIDQADNN